MYLFNSPLIFSSDEDFQQLHTAEENTGLSFGDFIPSPRTQPALYHSAGTQWIYSLDPNPYQQQQPIFSNPLPTFIEGDHVSIPYEAPEMVPYQTFFESHPTVPDHHLQIAQDSSLIVEGQVSTEGSTSLQTNDATSTIVFVENLGAGHSRCRWNAGCGQNLVGNSRRSIERHLVEYHGLVGHRGGAPVKTDAFFCKWMDSDGRQCQGEGPYELQSLGHHISCTHYDTKPAYGCSACKATFARSDPAKRHIKTCPTIIKMVEEDLLVFFADVNGLILWDLFKAPVAATATKRKATSEEGQPTKRARTQKWFWRLSFRFYFIYSLISFSNRVYVSLARFLYQVIYSHVSLINHHYMHLIILVV